jgi:hypothetical protein
MHGRLTEIRYAHPEGNNANDGLTWGTAKRDVVSAYDALPAVLGGDICVAPNTYMDSVNTDRGLWLLNQDDPSYNGGSPTLPGWRVGKPINLIGVGGGGHVSNAWERGVPILGGSGTDRLKPQLWIAGGIGPSTFKNIAFGACAVTARLGVTSTMSGTINTACLGFDGCSFDSTAFFATGGPTIELGYLFWGRWAQCGINRGNVTTTPVTSITLQGGTTYRFSTGAVAHRLRVGDSFQIEGVTPSGYNGVWDVTNVASTTEVDATIGSNPGAVTVAGTMRLLRSYYRAAVGHDVNVLFPGGTNSGLLAFQDVNSNGGGIYYSPNIGTTSGNIFVDDWTFEGAFGTAEPPVFHLARPGGAALAANNWVSGIMLSNVAHADHGAGSDFAVRNDYLAGLPVICVQNVGEVFGPVTRLYGGLGTGQEIGSARIASRHLNVGFDSWEVLGQHPGSNRAFSPTVALGTNFVSQDTSTWSGKPGALVVTTGKQAPDGSANAAKLANTATGVGVEHKELGSTSGASLAVGDWFVAGYWRRWTPIDADISFDDIPAEMKCLGVTLTNGDDNIKLTKPTIHGDGAWEWCYNAAKITAVSSPGNITFAIRVQATASNINSLEVFAPVAFVIPASAGIIDREVELRAQHLHTWPDTVPAGHVSTLRGQKLIAFGGLGVGNAVAATTPGSVTKKIEVFDAAGASLGFIPVYSTIT